MIIDTIIMIDTHIYIYIYRYYILSNIFGLN